MKRIPQESAMFGNFAAGCALSAVVIGAFIALVENSARATEPPDPPPQYTLTVNKRGGDSTCEVRLDLPETTGWSTDPIVRTYDAYTEYAPTQRVNCPVFYTFSHWESNDDDLDGWDETITPDFELIENTTATAVFEPVCPGQVLIDMYNNEEILGSDDLEYSPAPACQGMVTDLLCYEALLYVNPGNFSYAELSCNHGSLPDSHPHWQWDNGVSELFQDTRNQYGSAITVTSAFRCPRKNTDIGAKSTSKHVYGKAFDFDEITDQANWDVAVAASNFTNANRIFLYGGGPTGYRTYEWLVQNGYSGTTLPVDFTNGYTHGHVDKS